MTYEETRCLLAERYGWTFDTIDDMSFEQISLALGGGKERNKSIEIESMADIAWIQANLRKVYGF